MHFYFRRKVILLVTAVGTDQLTAKLIEEARCVQEQWPSPMGAEGPEAATQVRQAAVSNIIQGSKGCLSCFQFQQLLLNQVLALDTGGRVISPQRS